MIIEVLVCKPDGTQAFESREVSDDFFECGVLPDAEDGAERQTEN